MTDTPKHPNDAEENPEVHSFRDRDGFIHRRVPCGSQMYDLCGHCGATTPPEVAHQCISEEAKWLRRLTLAIERRAAGVEG